MPDNRPISPVTLHARENRPGAEAAVRSSVRIDSPPELLKVVPLLFGFHPTASVVIIGATPPRRTIKVSLRYPLYDPAAPDVAAHLVEHALKVLTSQDCGVALAIGYGPDAQVAPFIKLLRQHAGEHDLELPELLRVEDNRYWSYACTDPTCCPPAGMPFDPSPDPELAALLPAGVPEVLANRDALASLVAPVEGAAAQSMRRATRKVEAHVLQLAGQARATAGYPTVQHPVVPTDWSTVQEAIARYRQGGHTVTYAEAARLLVCLRDKWVRDDALCRMEADYRQADLRLWLDLTRLARPGSVGAPATLLAFVAWQSGNGTLANVALDRALTDDPDYQLAHLLRRILDSGMDPSKARPPLTPGHPAAAYRTVGSAGAARREPRE